LLPEIPEVPEIPELPAIPFEVTLAIQNAEKSVYPGDDLVVLGTIRQLGAEAEIVLPFHYQIRDENDVVIFDHTETMVMETRLTFEKTFHVAVEARLGTYTIFLEVPYNHTFISSSDTFYIIERSLFDIGITPGAIRVIPEEEQRRAGNILGILFVIVLLVLGLWKIRTIEKS